MAGLHIRLLKRNHAYLLDVYALFDVRHAFETVLNFTLISRKAHEEVT